MKLCKDCKYYRNVAIFHHCLMEPSFEKIDLVTGKVQAVQPRLDCRCERGGTNWDADGKAREWHYALDVDSEEGKNYINDLAFGLQFALDNRKTMLKRIENAIQHVGLQGNLAWNSLINRNHNHAELKGDLWIHRKGATHAEEGMPGVIPGNMRDGSFIVKGKGNPDSLYSSSHGAGRVLSRKAAKEQLNMQDFISTMQDNSVQAKVDTSTLDESPFAYKNIFEVMQMQTELVEVLWHVKPLINIKGASKEC